ncbi:MAG: hypothetical protein WHS86_00010 [Desulfosoma sp.]
MENAKVPITELPTGHVALDIHVFCLDNSKTQKEGVSRTYQVYDGYAPIGAYLLDRGDGARAWSCVGGVSIPRTVLCLSFDGPWTKPGG